MLHSDPWDSHDSPKAVLHSDLWDINDNPKTVLHSDLWDSNDSPKIVLHSDLWVCPHRPIRVFRSVAKSPQSYRNTVSTFVGQSSVLKQYCGKICGSDLAVLKQYCSQICGTVLMHSPKIVTSSYKVSPTVF